jgi:hypothetical protein
VANVPVPSQPEPLLRLVLVVTMGDHVIYESRLELARLLLADADPEVVGIAAQPFLLIEGVEVKPRRHVPDFFPPGTRLHVHGCQRQAQGEAQRLEGGPGATRCIWPISVSWPATGADGCSTRLNSRRRRRRSWMETRSESEDPENLGIKELKHSYASGGETRQTPGLGQR